MSCHVYGDEDNRGGLPYQAERVYKNKSEFFCLVPENKHARRAADCPAEE